MQNTIRKYTVPDYNIFTEWRPEQHFQRLDKYSNYLWEEFRLETWEEVIARTVDTLRHLSSDRLPFPEYQKMFDLMYRLEIMPSMRLLSMPWRAIERCNTVLYNCTSGLGDTLKAIAEAQYLSMSGAGVTWSVEKKNVDKIPAIKHQTGMMYYHVVEDTQIGWARATERLLNELAKGNDLTIDYSRVRPSGEPLKTKGGYASGPGILIQTHDFIRKTLKNAQGRKLRPIEMHDMFCYALESGSSGSLRRSAGMCIFDVNDTEILTCKYDGFWNHPEHKVRANANNSAVWGDSLSKNDIAELTNQAFSTGTGEPNLFKRGNEFRNKPEWREFIHPEFIGTNPCFVAGTMVQTKNGHYPIETLAGKEVEIWDGNTWTSVNNFRVTGENQPVNKITLHDGTEITATPYHKFILEDGTRKELKDLNVGDKLMIADAPLSHGNKKINGAYLKGFLLGDGTSTVDKVLLNLYEPKFICEERLIASANEIEPGEINTNAIADVHFGDVVEIKNTVRKAMKGINVRKYELYRYIVREHGLPQELFHADYQSKCEFIAGFMDADGTANDTENGFMYQISSVYPKILQDFQLLLKTIGVQSTLRLNRVACKKDFNDGYGEYDSQPLYRLTISQVSSVILASQVKFTRLVSFAEKVVSYNLKPRWNKIVQIVQDDIADKVYCCTVPIRHQFSLTNGVQTAQCGEVTMQPIPVDSEHIKGGGWQFCNLSTVNARHNDDFNSLYEKTKYATLIGDIQSLATNFDFLREGTKTICDKDRLLGVNLVGYATSPFVRNNPKLVEALRDYTVEIDLKFAKQFNVPRSAAITAVKPSGNHSVLCYTAPGANPIHSEKQIRNVTVNRNSAMHLFLESQGVPRHDYPGRDYASMFAFPIEYPEGSITLEQTTAIDQLEMWKFHKVHWCQHNPSISITYTPDEVDNIRKWLYENQDIIGGLAFFPKYESSYELLPIVAVSDERYAEFTKDYPKIAWEYYRLYEKAVDDRQQTSECAGGQCLVV